MKWLHYSAAVLCCLIFSLSSYVLAEQTQKNTLGQEKPLQTKRIALCGHPDYPPVSWTENGHIVGLAPDIVKRIFNRLDYEIDTKTVGNWKRCLRELQLGRVDVAVAYKTQEREAVYNFSHESVIDDPMAIFVNRERPFVFEQWSDLIGKTAGFMLGDSVGNQFDEFISEHIVVERVSKGAQNFGKLGRGHIDFIPYGLHTGNLLIQRLGLDNQIVALPKLAITNQYYLAVSQKSEITQYLELIDIELKKMQKSGEVKQLTDHYIRLYASKLRQQSYSEKSNRVTNKITSQ